ncbi:cation:proton antiporter [Amycolatopsis sp. cg9]|uniref:cation:proton antiporter domain-containing protein n=1 Tax=Amycolatopsis sp. cg9 TaxID=3238801 RepID=UPI0035233365
MLIVDVVIIVAVARLLGALLTRIGQPAVIGEILAGIVLGPTLMGESLNAALFPADVRPVLSWLANVGVIVFLFFIGLELDRSLLREQRRVVAAVAFGSLALPFALGVGLALLLLPAHPTGNALAFVLFTGTALSVTAFPVLARILTDRGMVHTRLGVLALTVAAVIDVVAWVLLAVVAAVVGTEALPAWRIALVVPYVALMVGGVRPLLRRFAERRPRPGPVASAGVLTGIGLGVAGSAAATSWMGLHAIFGAFLFGWVMPRTGLPLLRERVLPAVERASSNFLLPIFFAVAGFSVDLSTMDVSSYVELALVLVVAVAGKFAGTFTAAKAVGVPTRPATVLATLINTRGLTELIVLVVGLQLAVLDRQTYSIMVMMALLTTSMTGVILRLIHPNPRAGTSYADPPLPADEPSPRAT